MKENYKWFEIEISDSDRYNPRENDNLWTIVYINHKYSLWDKAIVSYWESLEDDFKTYIAKEYGICYKEPEDYTEEDVNEIEEYIKTSIIYLSVAWTDHWWMSIYVWNPRDRWDSWQVWFIYVTRDRIKEWFNYKTLTTDDIAKVKQVLQNEIEYFNKYITWESMYSYNIELLDESIWWYESEEDALLDAKDSIDASNNADVMKAADRIYETALDDFWNTVNMCSTDLFFDKDWEQDWDKVDLLHNVIWNKLKQY